MKIVDVINQFTFVGNKKRGRQVKYVRISIGADEQAHTTKLKNPRIVVKIPEAEDIQRNPNIRMQIDVEENTDGKN